MSAFLENNPMYVILIINLIIWAGIFGYLYTMNKKMRTLIKEKQEN